MAVSVGHGRLACAAGKEHAMKAFLEKYADAISGTVSGWDRIRFRGTHRWLASVSGLGSYLGICGILLKDFGKWAEAATAKVRAICEDRAKDLGIPMIYLESASTDKDEMARQIMEKRGLATGDVCMFRVVEPCIAPTVCGNRESGTLEVAMRPRRCTWIYHYWNDEKLGFGHSRLQTWLPHGATICLNGRHWLERQLMAAGIGYAKDGNCFSSIDDYAKAAELVEEQQRTDWAKLLRGLVERSCPGLGTVLGGPEMEHYGSAEQTEWATDVVFRSAADLDRIFPHLVRHSMVVSQSASVMRFLGKSGRGRAAREVVSDVRTRFEGVRAKHRINGNSIKASNKNGNNLRVETTINQPREFKVFRHPNDDPDKPAKWQRMRKGTADLRRRAAVCQASNERYLDHLAAADASERLGETVGDVCKRTRKGGKRHRALNPWGGEDFKMLAFLARGEHSVNGFVNRQLREELFGKSKNPAETKKRSGQTTRRIRLLRAHGLIRKVKGSNRYQLTQKGRKIAAAVLAASAAGTEKLMEIAS
jgi:hypothetical protein